MDRIKAKLRTNHFIYALTEYFAYDDDTLFKSIERLLVKEEALFMEASNLVDYYKEELIFNYNIKKHDVIIPIPHKSEKFNTLNQKICMEISELLNIKYDDTLIKGIVENVDIRDAYTKNKIDLNLELNIDESLNYIFFDFVTATGAIFNDIQNKIKNSNSLFLSYGIRQNITELTNTFVEVLEKIKPNNISEEEKYGYVVRIYGLFGDKDVQIDLSNRLDIVIGENGFGKSTAIKLAMLIMNYRTIIESTKETGETIESDKKLESIKRELAKYYFKKIEIYEKSNFYTYEKRLLNLKKYAKKTFVKQENDGYNQAIYDLYKVGKQVYNEKYKIGTIIEPIFTDGSSYCKVEFPNNIIKDISYNHLSLCEKDQCIIGVYENNRHLKNIYVKYGGFLNKDELKYYDIISNKGIINEPITKNCIIEVKSVFLISDVNTTKVISKKKHNIRSLTYNPLEDFPFEYNLEDNDTNYSSMILDKFGMNKLPKFEDFNEINIYDFYINNEFNIKYSYYDFIRLVEEYYNIESIENEEVTTYHKQILTFDYSDLIYDMINDSKIKEFNTYFEKITTNELSNFIRKIYIKDYSIHEDISNYILKYNSIYDEEVLFNILTNTITENNFENDSYNQEFINSNIFLIDCTKPKELSPFTPEYIMKSDWYNSGINSERFDEFIHNRTMILEQEDYYEAEYENDEIDPEEVYEYYQENQFTWDDDMDLMVNSEGEYEEPYDFIGNSMGSKKENYNARSTILKQSLKKYNLEDKSKKIHQMEFLYKQYSADVRKNINNNKVDKSIDNEFKKELSAINCIHYYTKSNVIKDYIKNNNTIELHKILSEYFNLDILKFIFTKYLNIICDINEAVQYNQTILDVTDLFTNDYSLNDTISNFIFGADYQHYQDLINSIDPNKRLVKYFNSANLEVNIGIDDIVNYINLEQNSFKNGLLHYLNNLDNKKANVFKKIIKNLLNSEVSKYTKKDKYKLNMIYKVLVIYNEILKNDKLISLNKIISKYFIDKEVNIYTNNIIIKKDNNIIPINKLSSGESNLIIMLFSTIFCDKTTFILDEPDISLSVKWQNMLINDLLRTNNKFIILTQSPSLVNKNGLSKYITYLNVEPFLLGNVNISNDRNNDTSINLKQEVVTSTKDEDKLFKLKTKEDISLFKKLRRNSL